MDLEIAAALKHGNYQEVALLIANLPPDDPWGQLYQAQLHEAQTEWESAESLYRELLRQGHVPKLALEARQGLQRLAQRQQEEQRDQTAQRQVQIARTVAQSGQGGLGVLILEALSPEVKAEVAPAFAHIMRLDLYSARLLLPSRGWRFYRTGAIGELQVYGQELQDSRVPSFWKSLEQVRQVKVHQACYFKTVQDPVQVVVTEAHSSKSPRVLSFKWSEVVQSVTGQLPIFEEVVDLDARGVLQRKEKTQDYAQFRDLHLPSGILRFYDAAYQFNQGVPLAADSSEPGTSWSNWRNLTALWQENLPDVRSWNEFSTFADTIIEQTDTLDRIDAHINLFRRAESYWDQAFHLYSSLAYLK
ncbi:hypothetical protein C1752_00831 [Acaryochloris thomasi RCC1774]|uniref:Tetratricopeptide repeat protein n=1 Tax=Acaryochloris thomasi RCC1774 TaxID=1764569 RepID=A0A2W1K416_9CYAN|nr:hypothetical protein [Acaryochloris thomasi]PZD74617.1 hypothetical protein C1752_00831 [Acaryochloris thomasi RCC1774]